MTGLRTSALLALLVTASLLVGCGDDDSGNGDGGLTLTSLAGLWLIQSMRVDDAGGSMTMTRDGSPEAVRGDVQVFATEASAGAVQYRQTLLENGLMDDGYVVQTYGVTLDGNKWLHEHLSGEVNVFTMALSGNTLTLSLDATDQRNTNDDAPSEIVLSRANPWSTDLIGTWEMMSMTVDGETITPSSCVQVSDDRWSMIVLAVEIGDALIFDMETTDTSYSDSSCTTLDEPESSFSVGFAEHEGNTFRLWLVTDFTPEYLEFTTSISGDVATLTRTACLPGPDCTSDSPSELVLRRVAE